MSIDARKTLIGLLEGMRSSTWQKPGDSKIQHMLLQLRADTSTAEKLVRNEPGQCIRGEGKTIRVAALHEMPQLLANKLVEEAREVAEAVSTSVVRALLVEELADVAEVISALQDELQIRSDEVNHARIHKRIHKGGFNERLVAAVDE